MDRGGHAHFVRDRDEDLVAAMDAQRRTKIAPVETARGGVATGKKRRPALLSIQCNAVGLSPRINQLWNAKRIWLGSFEPLKTRARRRCSSDDGRTSEKGTSGRFGYCSLLREKALKDRQLPTSNQLADIRPCRSGSGVSK